MKRRLYRPLAPLLILLLSFAPRAHAAQLVVHPSVAQAEITRNVARLLFTMRLVHWSDGSRVRVFVLADTDPTHREFTKQTLDLYPRQLRRAWDRHLYSGSGAFPTRVGTVEEMLERIARTPGAVGYLPDAVVSGRVRVLHVK